MKSPMIDTKRGGFTLIELIIAMALFSMMLLVVMTGFLNVVKLQQSGLAVRDTQQSARFALEQIEREARNAVDEVLAPPATLPSGASSAICLTVTGGVVRFYLSSSDKRLHRETLNPTQTCSGAAATPAGGAQGDTAITPDTVDVVEFSVAEIVANGAGALPNPPKSLQISLRVAFKGSSLNVAKQCNPGSGSQFCSVTVLTSTVSLRGAQ